MTQKMKSKGNMYIYIFTSTNIWRTKKENRNYLGRRIRTKGTERKEEAEYRNNHKKETIRIYGPLGVRDTGETGQYSDYSGQ